MTLGEFYKIIVEIAFMRNAMEYLLLKFILEVRCACQLRNPG